MRKFGVYIPLSGTRYGVIAHNLARWTTRIGLGEAGNRHQDPPTTLLLPGRTPHPQGPPHHPASSPTLALAKPIHQRPGPTARPAPPILTTAATASARPPNYPTASRTCSRPVSACLLSQRVRLLRPSPSPRQVTKPIHNADTLSTQTNPSGSAPCCLSPSLLILQSQIV